MRKLLDKIIKHIAYIKVRIPVTMKATTTVSPCTTKDVEPLDFLTLNVTSLGSCTGESVVMEWSVMCADLKNPLASIIDVKYFADDLGIRGLFGSEKST